MLIFAGNILPPFHRSPWTLVSARVWDPSQYGTLPQCAPRLATCARRSHSNHAHFIRGLIDYPAVASSHLFETSLYCDLYDDQGPFG
ncbi:hypothetical protein CC2G_006611 [Coprinopsis cinerea AmutBmut pab1-1]|nr:hypothetical protein CC2G_006611 [Coprinopsis cinerea AmutBmut pab1-1]